MIYPISSKTSEENLGIFIIDEMDTPFHAQNLRSLFTLNSQLDSILRASKGDDHVRKSCLPDH